MEPFALGESYYLAIPPAAFAPKTSAAAFATPRTPLPPPLASPVAAAGFAFPTGSPKTAPAAPAALPPLSMSLPGKDLWIGDFELPAYPGPFFGSADDSAAVHHLTYADSYPEAFAAAHALEPLPDTRIAAQRAAAHPYTRPAASSSVASSSRSRSPVRPAAAAAAAALAFRGGVSPSAVAAAAASSSSSSPSFPAGEYKVAKMDDSDDDVAVGSAPASPASAATDADATTALVPAPMTSAVPASIATAHGASFVGRIRVTSAFAWPKVARPSKEAHLPFDVTYASGERVSVTGFVLRLVNETGMRGQGGWVPRPGREVIARPSLYSDARGHAIGLLIEPVSPAEDEDKKLRLAYGLAVAKEAKGATLPDHVGYLCIDPARPGSGTSFRVTVFAEAPVTDVAFGRMRFNDRFTSLLGSTVALDMNAA